MTDLPDGWEWATVGEVGTVGLGRQRAPKWHHGPNMRPYLRVANVFEDRIDLTDVKEMDFSPEDSERFKLEPGDILLNEGQSPEWVGRPAMYRGELPGACFTNSLIRFRPHPGIDGRYALYLFRHYLHSQRFMREARITTNIAHLSATRFAGIEFPVPPSAEQERIVDAIDEHLSRVDSAASQLAAVLARLQILESTGTSGLDDAWPRRPLDELAKRVTKGTTPTTLGFDYVSEGVRFVKAESLSAGRISAARCAAIDEATHTALKRSQLEAGDLLVTIAGTLGRVAEVVEADLPANTNQAVAVIRLKRPDTSSFLRRWLATPAGRRELLSGGRGVGLQNLNLAQIRALNVPTPPHDEMTAFCRRFDALSDGIERQRAACRASLRRAAALRRSILVAAFSGRLVAQDSSDESGAVLLERIRAERGTTGPSKRTRKAKPA